MKKLAVLAFGGNALLRSGQKGTIEEQSGNIKNTCSNLIPLIKNDYNIVIGHGNGPQVGNVLLTNNAGFKMFGIPEFPLDVCGAYTQGFIGYVIEQQLRNLLAGEGIDKDIITLVTQVQVDKNDPAFANPTKPVGPYYTKEEADKVTEETGAQFAEDPKGRGWRKVVASPKPIEIKNIHTIESLAREGQIVVTVGGGGIPVYKNGDNTYHGVEAVIDKDLASALLAAQIKADEFYILTDVSKICLHFNTPQEKQLDTITVAEAKQYLADGHFAEGSMAPKVRAAIYFVENGGKETIITDANELGKPNAGTRIVLQ